MIKSVFMGMAVESMFMYSDYLPGEREMIIFFVLSHNLVLVLHLITKSVCIFYYLCIYTLISKPFQIRDFGDWDSDHVCVHLHRLL